MDQITRVSTVVFDMDGVLIDSELHWEALEQSYLAQNVPSWNKQDYSRLTGLSLPDVFILLKDEYGFLQDEPEFRQAYEKMADWIYGRYVNLLPGAKATIEALQHRGIKLGLASSSPRRWVEIVLSRFELEHFFTSVLSGSEIEGKGKPAPDIYLASAKALRSKPGDCAVIEDSRNGVLAAKAAGMFCYGLRNGSNDNQDLSAADIEITGFKPLLDQL